jgi:allophanate hydrolase
LHFFTHFLKTPLYFTCIQDWIHIKMPSKISSSSPPAEHAWIRRFETELGSATGPLSGLRFAVKDNIDVAYFLTTAGCAEFAYTPDSSAHVVQKLLNAGAKLVGKTNLDQFACGLNGTRSPFGSVPNAFSNEYVSGGSSSGSAYVVATGEVDFALGTDTAGSGRVPAGLNNIVGLKPSRGLISCTGVVPAAQSVDTVSIFASNVPLAWRVLQACMGYDPQDPYSRTIHLRRSPFSAQLRVGIPDDLNFFGDTAAEAEFEKALSQLKAMGAQLISIPYAPFKQAAELLYGSALVAERHAAIKSFFDQHESQVEYSDST